MTKKRRRWHRIAIPFIILILLNIAVFVPHWLAEPDSSDAHYLSPTVAGETSAQKLAETLQGKGITVRRETKTSDALTAFWSMGGKATLFVPAPEHVNPTYLWMLRQSPAGSRIVMVEPGDAELAQAVPRAAAAQRRWATAVTSAGPECKLTTAKRAAVTRTRYTEWLSPEDELIGKYCFEQGLVSLSFNGIEFVLAGSDDPFRGDRLSENDNAQLATDLLSARPTLIWLDLHAAEPNPLTYSEQSPPPNGKPIPSLAPGREVERPDASPRPKQSTTYSPRPRQTADGTATMEAPSPFPNWLVPLFVMLALAALALAIARGRRLGAPLTEPLPIEVKGAETAIGRSRLYRRAKARGAALDTLRLEARRRIGQTLGLPPQPDREVLLDALAARLGRPREQLADILFGPSPENDAELESRTIELLQLVEHVTRNGREK